MLRVCIYVYHEVSQYVQSTHKSQAGVLSTEQLFSAFSRLYSSYSALAIPLLLEPFNGGKGDLRNWLTPGCLLTHIFLKYITGFAELFICRYCLMIICLWFGLVFCQSQN